MILNTSIHIFECETDHILPVIFEHKIANAHGSYQFYHDILINPISRKPIDKISKDHILELIEYFKNKSLEIL